MAERRTLPSDVLKAHRDLLLAARILGIDSSGWGDLRIGSRNLGIRYRLGTIDLGVTADDAWRALSAAAGVLRHSLSVAPEAVRRASPGHCGAKGDHEAHEHESGSLGLIACSGRDSDRHPGKAERWRQESEGR